MDTNSLLTQLDSLAANCLTNQRDKEKYVAESNFATFWKKCGELLSNCADEIEKLALQD